MGPEQRKTKDQRYYRKRVADGQKDFRSTQREDGTTGVRVTRKTVNVRVSNEAAEKLKSLADKNSKPQWEILSHILIVGLPVYQSLNDSGRANERYSWPDELMNPTDKKTSYKGTMGDKAINMQITSTAWNKLQCHSTKTETSKARIVQRLILNYQPTSQTKRDQSKAYRERNQNHKVNKAKELEPAPNQVSKRWTYFRILSYGAVVHKKAIPQSKWTDEELQEYVQIMETQQARMRDKLADQSHQGSTITDPEAQPTTNNTPTTDDQHLADAEERRRIEIEDEIINIRQFLDDPLMWDDEDDLDELKCRLTELEDELRLPQTDQ